MTDTLRIAKAELRELDPKGTETGKNRVTVQFNPETLKVSYANQVVPPDTNSASDGKSTDKRGTSAIQFVGKGSTKLNVQLWFDATAAMPEGQARVDDVRELTRQVTYFITPIPDKTDPQKFLPPGLRFLWGTFQFDGILESLEESLEFFSADGEPLRASVTISMTQQAIQFTIRKDNRGKNAVSSAPAGALGGAPVGTKPLTQARAGETLQGMAGEAGLGTDWRGIAEANGVENPRLLAPGQLIDLSARTRS